MNLVIMALGAAITAVGALLKPDDQIPPVLYKGPNKEKPAKEKETKEAKPPGEA